MRRNQRLVEIMGRGSFRLFLEEAIKSMSQRSYRGHFRKCGYTAPDISDDEDSSSELSSSESSTDSE
jgi:hypothetical protein